MTEQSNPTRAAAVERLAEELREAAHMAVVNGCEADIDDYRDIASSLLSTLGAVFVDAGVVEQIRSLDLAAHAMDNRCKDEMTMADRIAVSRAAQAATSLRLALADHVMGQVEEKAK